MSKHLIAVHLLSLPSHLISTILTHTLHQNACEGWSDLYSRTWWSFKISSKKVPLRVFSPFYEFSHKNVILLILLAVGGHKKVDKRFLRIVWITFEKNWKNQVHYCQVSEVFLSKSFKPKKKKVGLQVSFSHMHKQFKACHTETKMFVAKIWSDFYMWFFSVQTNALKWQIGWIKMQTFCD